MIKFNFHKNYDLYKISNKLNNEVILNEVKSFLAKTSKDYNQTDTSIEFVGSGIIFDNLKIMINRWNVSEGLSFNIEYGRKLIIRTFIGLLFFTGLSWILLRSVSKALMFGISCAIFCAITILIIAIWIYRPILKALCDKIYAKLIQMN
jgi:hypothetical protein